MIAKIFTIFISILLLPACSHAEDNKSKVIIESQSASSVIGDLRKLNVNQNIITSDQDLEVFLTGFKHLQIGAIDKAQEIFTALQSSQDKDKKEYGEYGLLLFAYETENMFNMQRSLQRIETLERKSDWLGKELRNYEIYYNYNTANFTKSEEFLDLVPTSELIKSPFLSSVKADLYIRNNDLDKSKKVLTRLEHEGEDSVAMYAKLVYLSKGSQEAVNYLANKVTKYPNNESI